MLVIRQSQLDSFAKGRAQRFEDRMTAHLREQLPGHYAALGEAETRRAIGYGIERARSYGIESEPGVTIYLRHMFLFGQDFDRDPKLAWAGEVLSDKSIAEEQTRMQRLTAESMAYLRRVAGVPEEPA